MNRLEADPCPHCLATFARLDALLREGVAEAPTLPEDAPEDAPLHVLAAVATWWASRSLGQFPTRQQGAAALVRCFAQVLLQEGIRLEAGPWAETRH
jgi:hypothetical protein